MRIAVASGKGGTGKTTIALALAECAPPGSILIDCDVEEPNCHLFSPGLPERSLPVEVAVPEFLPERCTGCGKCVAVCRFHALAHLGKRVLVFPELCHSCGGCVRACPEGALIEKPHSIGEIEFRQTPHFPLISGVLKIGHAMAPPVIRKLKEYAQSAENVIFDAPPGTACPMVTTVRDCEYVLLVTEPTPFGLHDLKLAVRTLAHLNLKVGVILNRSTPEGDAMIESYCQTEAIPLLLKVPFARKVAEGYAQGKSLLQTMPELKKEFQQVLQTIGDAS